MVYSKVLVFGDPHATPGIPNDRFEAAGNLIVKERPDMVVIIGDMGDMPSLSKYDKGKVKAEGQRYQADIECVIEANELLWEPLHRLNKQLLRAGSVPYIPRKVFITGNHERRILRAAEEDPKLWDWLKMEDLQLERFGWEVIPFLQPFECDNIIYQHYFTQGNMDSPIAGVNHARRLTLFDGKSRICGHTHELQWWYEGKYSPRIGMSVGCFFEHQVDYMSPTQQQGWWRGLVMLEDCGIPGKAPNFRLFPMDKVMEYL